MSVRGCLRPLARAAVLSAVTVSLLGAAPVAEAAPRVGFEKVAEAVEPTSLTSPPGRPGTLVVTERPGKVRVLVRGRWRKKPLLDLTRQIDPLRIERGLLGLAFAPDFRRSRRFYVNYTERSGDSLVVEYRAGRKLRVRKNSRRVVLRIPKVNDTGNHNGGHLRFHGGLLYISSGDGFDPGDAPRSAQNLESLRGKILRIDPRPDPATGRGYRIPAGNPFNGLPGRDEIFAYGLRNPHSFSFFARGGRQWISVSDVGQGRFEELNTLPLAEARGANFGWNDYEGFEPYNCGELYCPNGSDPVTTTGLTWPQLVYSHEEGCAIIGGPMVEDRSLPSLKGRLIYGDFCSNRIRTAVPRLPVITDDRAIGFFLPPGRNRHSALNGFGVDEKKRIYAFSHAGGIYRITERRQPGGR